MSLVLKTFSSILQEGYGLPLRLGRTRKSTNISCEAKNVSHARGITDVVVFVFKPQRPRKFDDLPLPLRVNSSTFRWLESSFLRTFTLYCEFSIDQGDFRSNFLAGDTNVRSKSP